MAEYTGSKFAPMLNAAITPSGGGQQSRGYYPYGSPATASKKMTKLDKFMTVVDIANQLGMTENIGGLLNWYFTTPAKERKEHLQNTLPFLFKAKKTKNEIKEAQEKDPKKVDPSKPAYDAQGNMIINIPGSESDTVRGGVRTPFNPGGAGTGSTQANRGNMQAQGFGGFTSSSGAPDAIKNIVNKASSLVGGIGKGKADVMQDKIDQGLSPNFYADRPEDIKQAANQIDDALQSVAGDIGHETKSQGILDKLGKLYGKAGYGLTSKYQKVKWGLEDKKIKKEQDEWLDKFAGGAIDAVVKDNPFEDFGGPKDLWEDSIKEMALSRVKSDPELSKKWWAWTNKQSGLAHRTRYDREQSRMNNKERWIDKEVNNTLSDSNEKVGNPAPPPVNTGVETELNKHKVEGNHNISEQLKKLNKDANNLVKGQQSENNFNVINNDPNPTQIKSWKDINNDGKIDVKDMILQRNQFLNNTNLTQTQYGVEAKKNPFTGSYGGNQPQDIGRTYE